ncbi:MAG: hypothetical protein HDT47_03520 [Ruminococcaceae bacterium]|nr:hypothetical protein [Oscillospiraceae bacterium]
MSGGAACISKLKCVSISKFPTQEKIWLRPGCRAVNEKGAAVRDRAVRLDWVNKHYHTLYRLMGAANVTN